MPPVTMPKLSDSMEEGTIVRWLRAAGEQIEPGDELVEIETDKATMAYEAEVGGVLQIVLEEGASVRVGMTIGHIDDGTLTEDEAGTLHEARQPTLTLGNGAAGSARQSGFQSVSPPMAAPRANASPVARRMARALGVPLEALGGGSGPRGRIVRRDVEAVAQNATTPQVVPVTTRTTASFEPLNGIQATIARRMVEAKSTMPDFNVSTDIDMEAAIALRAQLGGLAQGERPPSLGDCVIKACALALREHPRVNASFRDGGVEIHGRINVGVAIASDSALFVATVTDADAKPVGQIAAEVRALALRGRDGRLTPAEMEGATFTVSNLGMYGVTQFTAVLNPPQAAILAVGSVQQRVVAHDGQPTVRHQMTVTLSCDHRVLYGADAAAFLGLVRTKLEEPLRLFL